MFNTALSRTTIRTNRTMIRRMPHSTTLGRMTISKMNENYQKDVWLNDN